MPLLTTGAGVYASAAVAPSGYVGPVDVISGALGFWGLRAASSAKAGTVAAVRLIRSGGSGGSGADEQDIGTNASTGELDFTGTFFTGTGYTYKVVTLYNQYVSGTVGHMVPTSVPSGRPTFLMTGWDGKPVIQFSTTTDLAMPSGGASTYNMPVLFSTVTMRHPNAVGVAPGASPKVIFIVDYNVVQIYAGNGSMNGLSMYPSTIAGAPTDGALNAILALYNSTASVLRVNDQVTTGDTSIATPFVYYGPGVNAFLGSNPMTMTEVGFWQGSDPTALLAALQANMTAFWIAGTRAQWDPKNGSGTPIASHFNFSNDNRTITCQTAGGAGVDKYIYSLGTATSNQKVYVEHVVGTITGSAGVLFGIATTGATEANTWGTATTSKSALINYNGTFLCADSANHNTATIASFTTGDRVGMAFDSATGKLWFRKNGGGWNSVIGGAQDPAAGTGGVAVPFAAPYYVFACPDDIATGDNFTTGFATATWTDTPPGSGSTLFTQLTRTA